MTELIAVFKSRSQAMDANMRLKMQGIPSGLINTPKEVNIGCGLSVKIPQNLSSRGKQIILSGKYSAFFGFFMLSTAYGRTMVKRL